MGGLTLLSGVPSTATPSEALAAAQLRDFEACMISDARNDGKQALRLLSVAIRCHPQHPFMLDLVLANIAQLADPAAVFAAADAASGDTPLIEAVGPTRSVALLRSLLSSRGAIASVNSTNRLGQSALMLAAQNRFSAGVRLLLEAGADVDARDSEGGSVLEAACASRPVLHDSTWMLLAYDASIDGAVLRACAPRREAPRPPALLALLGLACICFVYCRLNGRRRTERRRSQSTEASGNESAAASIFSPRAGWWPERVAVRLRRSPPLLMGLVVLAFSLLTFIQVLPAASPTASASA
jgi:hypothetical protein